MNLTGLHGSVKGHRRRRRIGRGPGSGCGKTSGRGHKGFYARSGNTLAKGYEGGQMPYFRRIPKRGFSNADFRKEYAVINLRDLARFEAGRTVGPQEFAEAGLLKRSTVVGVKILGRGELDRPLTVRAHAFSKAAAERIVERGGKAELIKK